MQNQNTLNKHIKEITNVFQVNTRHKQESRELQSLYYGIIRNKGRILLTVMDFSLSHKWISYMYIHSVYLFTDTQL